MTKLKERLRKLLKEKAYKIGNFSLTSEKKTDYYIDCKSVMLSSEGAYLCGEVLLGSLLKKLDDWRIGKIDAIGGMEFGACPLVTATSIAAFRNGIDWPGFIVRKQTKGHGTQSRTDGLHNIPSGSNVAILEDVITTGKTLLEAIKVAEKQHLHVVAVIALVNRQEGGDTLIRKLNYSFHSVFNKIDLM